MKPLPKKYEWLAKEGAPKMLVEALRHHGVLEYKGKNNNPDITKWADEIGGKVDDVYVADSIPWCGLFLAIVAKRSGKQLPKDPLWALNWASFGTFVKEPELGDILVFTRKTSAGKLAGHVAIYVGEDAEAYHILGGNQNDAVTISRMPKSRLYVARRPIYSIAKPANVRKIQLSSKGELLKSAA